MTSIGDRLRTQRLQNRISLEKISLETKIGVRLLEAIEAEHFEKLPGGVFRRNFVLQYARALGVDPGEIAEELKQLSHFDEVPQLPTADMLRGVEPVAPSRFSFPGDLTGIAGSTIGSLLAALGVIMVCALIYGWWQTARRMPRSIPPPARAELAPAKPQVAIAPLDAPISKEPEAAAAPAPPPTAVVPVASTAPLRVELIVGEKTWISISSDGRNIFSSSLEPHETKLVEASEKIRLLIGNAGGVEISLNGKPIGPVGSKGQIRVVELTPAGFQIVPPKAPTLAPL